MSALSLAVVDAATLSAPLYTFNVMAEANPGMLPRLVHEYAKRDLVPVSFHARFVAVDRLEVEIVLQGGDDDLAALIANKLRVIPFVLEVTRR
ncbi:hypothetical protein [Roseiterribacter gracilis]|uniref:ACT domain-containing protein n=1 Tax=Roseiterribacter gracilis TaxID=2812848 RepID=A0A8S8X704_9PROT|nr:hypothetical protein TMPK1_02110 [Rhodospirillales bacterium TMPK1]